MDEKDSMTPDTIPQSMPVDGTVPAGRKNRRPVVIGVAAVAAVALVAGGVCGYRAYEIHRVSMAREACQSAVTDLNKAVKSYKALLGADATTAALKTDATSVKDAKTLDALRKAAGVETPGMVKCDASDKTGLDEATAKADKTTKGVKAGAKALESAVKAVESSKLDKTVADADGLYKATEGNVQDEKTREALKQAIAKRDAGAIAKAVKSVNDSRRRRRIRKPRRRPNRRRRLRPPPKRPPRLRPRRSSRIRLPDSHTLPRIQLPNSRTRPRIRAVAPAVACRTSFQAAADTAVQMIALRPLRTV